MNSNAKKLSAFVLAIICGAAYATPFCFKVCKEQFTVGTPDYQECVNDCRATTGG
ncbi:hypothetical protein [Paucibacter sp. M5-1]|uniref:hypothetical protein n=1 Tax=Paucibacter sp. M5-1 TaxID=3015998 RepID=UPI0022B92AA2|nr:hypothetical protein [Paucibacter sp. M5-1]MCZ7883717.1 hypothetical protein [Paucibacter sp. M5-1]